MFQTCVICSFDKKHWFLSMNENGYPFHNSDIYICAQILYNVFSCNSLFVYQKTNSLASLGNENTPYHHHGHGIKWCNNKVKNKRFSLQQREIYWMKCWWNTIFLIKIEINQGCWLFMAANHNMAWKYFALFFLLYKPQWLLSWSKRVPRKFQQTQWVIN